MTETVQFNVRIDPNYRDMLKRMAASDLRTLRGQLEWLIREEQKRRNEPHHKLVDTPVEYVTEKERT